jgi:hypothetical protein
MKSHSLKKADDYEHMVEVAAVVMSTLRTYATRLAPAQTREDDLIDRKRAQRWLNAIEYLRTLLGLYEWRYALLPVGVCQRTQRYFGGNAVLYTTTKQLHVFGVRLARWIVKTEVHGLALPPPNARLRLRKRRRRRP